MRSSETARDDGERWDRTKSHEAWQRHWKASKATTSEQPAAGSYPLTVPRQERRGERRGGHDPQARWAERMTTKQAGGWNGGDDVAAAVASERERESGTA